MMVDLTPEELELLVEALDSHAYWQLSDPAYRRDGYVTDPGADDPEVAEEIKQTKDLAEKLYGLTDEGGG